MVTDSMYSSKARKLRSAELKKRPLFPDFSILTVEDVVLVLSDVGDLSEDVVGDSGGERAADLVVEFALRVAVLVVALEHEFRINSNTSSQNRFVHLWFHCILIISIRTIDL